MMSSSKQNGFAVSPALAVAIVAAAMLLLPPGIADPAFAHGEEARDLDFAWTFDPWIVVPLATIGMLYLRGLMQLRRHARLGRHALDRAALFYCCGWLVLAGALVSPLHALGEMLFTAHMIEHELVMAVAAPLLVISRPAAALLWGLPDILRRATGWLMSAGRAQTLWRWITSGAVATVLHGAAIWLWHAPALFDAAVEEPIFHRLQHLSFFLTAVLFWWSIFRRNRGGVTAWLLFVTMLHTGLLGAIIALSPTVLYLAQTRSAEHFGLTPLEDQQLAGLMMWIPAGMIYAGAALLILAEWIARSDKGETDVNG